MNKGKDNILKRLFSELSDEQLPIDLNFGIMEKIESEVVLREKRRKIYNVIGYVFSGLIMIALCVFTWIYMGLSFKAPDIKLLSMPDFEALKSPSFRFSFFIGALAFFLLVADSMFRRHHFKK
jgi:TRAP-type C4-dicarboxylate transport system permease small subunit